MKFILTIPIFFTPKEQESIRTIKNLFNFFLNRNSWERNKDKIENQVEKLNIKINYRIKKHKMEILIITFVLLLLFGDQ